MMEDGLFERFPCDAVFAMHNMPGVPQGQLVFRDGAAMASSDYATICGGSPSNASSSPATFDQQRSHRRAHDHTRCAKPMAELAV